jgi:hypothetical protein
MNSLPANRRGVGGGMSTTFQNTSMVLSIGIFFSLMIAGLAGSLPATMQNGLAAHGVPAAQAHAVAGLPPVSVLFASLLGYNPVQSLLGDHTLAQLHPADASYLTGHTFFPSLISGPFHDGLVVAFAFAIVACLIAAVASWLMGGKFVHADDEHEVAIDFAQPEAGDPESDAEVPDTDDPRTTQPEVARS